MNTFKEGSYQLIFSVIFDQNSYVKSKTKRVAAGSEFALWSWENDWKASVISQRPSISYLPIADPKPATLPIRQRELGIKICSNDAYKLSLYFHRYVRKKYKWYMFSKQPFAAETYMYCRIEILNIVLPILCNSLALTANCWHFTALSPSRLELLVSQ